MNEPTLNIGISTIEDKKRTKLYKEGFKEKNCLIKHLQKKVQNRLVKSLKIELNIKLFLNPAEICKEYCNYLIEQISFICREISLILILF